MRRVNLLLLAAVLLTAGVASANTVWNPAANGYVAGDVVEWNEVPTNWANGTPVSTGDGSNGNDPKAVFNVADPATCRISAGNDADWGTLVMGDNGAASPQNALLEIMPGATLKLGASNSWSSIGYSRDCGTVLVHRGATIDMDCHLYLGMNSGGDADLIIDGGTVLVADTFRYGRVAGADGELYINAGLFQARYLNSAGPVDGGLVDIAFGKYRLTGGENQDRDRLQRDIDNGYVVAFGGQATPVLAQEANGDWYVVADSDPLNRVPTMDAYVYTNIALPLSWDNLPNLEPNVVDGDVYVDVWFGTDDSWVEVADVNDPAYPGYYVDWNKVVDAGTNTTTVDVDASVNAQEYMWRVDTYQYGEPNDSLGVDTGIQMYFTAVDDFPVEAVGIDTPPTITWINEPINLSATITDDDVSAPIITWSSNEPNAVFTNEAYDAVTGIATADVTVDYHSGPFTVTIEVTDSSLVGGTVSDSVNLDCAATACMATDVLGIVDQHPADVDGNCVIDIADLQQLVLDWVFDYTVGGPTPIPQP